MGAKRVISVVLTLILVIVTFAFVIAGCTNQDLGESVMFDGSEDNMTEQPEGNISKEDDTGEQQEKFESNILDDYEKRAQAETFILTLEREAYEKAYSSGSEMLYYDPESLCVYVDDELTNFYIQRQLIYDIDPNKDPEEAKELYLNHYYSVVVEYVAEYDPNQFSIVDGEEGRVRVKIELMILERNGQWEIYDNQYRGCTHVSDGSTV